MSHVVAHVESKGAVFNWEPVMQTPNGEHMGQSVVFTDEEWLAYETVARQSFSLSIDAFHSINATNEEPYELQTTNTALSLRSQSGWGYSTGVCFESGIWILQKAYNIIISYACDGVLFGVAVGSKQILRIYRNHDGQELFNGNGERYFLTVIYAVKKTKNVASKAYDELCTDALNWLITRGCHGDNEDSRGGTVKVTQQLGENGEDQDEYEFEVDANSVESGQ
ncbi:hypothetical protein BDV95DRAFT_604876 [Massariosphaeria phaeospora]|uniref:Uncharacterized protein n=1 Tax=Massariosphaeria phaeospora TaxID=100035 RepID=A0A7C8I8J8_9PLEO|nr:hypothetical protein BDV95DRAFT_604876 [Massariosphaeria phaeospora]